MAKQERVRTRVEELEEGGSLIGSNGPEVVRFGDCRYITTDEWNGSWKSDAQKEMGGDATMFASQLTPIDEDGEEGETSPENWATGHTTEVLLPSDDGEFLVVADGAKAGSKPKRRSKYGMLLTSVVDNKGDEAWFDDASGVDGLVARVRRESHKFKDRSGTDREYTVLVIDEILEEPGSKKPRGRKPTTRTPARNTPARGRKPAKDDDEVDAAAGAEAILQSILADAKGNKILRPKLLAAVATKLEEEDFAEYADAQEEIGTLLMDKEFVSSLDGVKQAGALISLA